MREFALPSSSLVIHVMFPRIDMYSIQSAFLIRYAETRLNDSYTAGTAKDVSFLIDFLPAYLFPSGERTISQWMIAGISLGGHSTWIALKNGQ